MNATDFFAEAEMLPVTSLDHITRGGGLVVVAPHPDDESLGCGGVIAEASSLGISTRVVVVSDGTGSHPGSRRFPKERLCNLREEETIAAVAKLGVSADAVRFLRLPDRFVPTQGSEADAARDAIFAAVSEVRAGAVLVTWRHDPHCDHAAAAALVAGLKDRLGGTNILSYPVWGWTLPPETEVGAAPRGWRVDITPHLAAKASAIDAHRSQTTNLIDDDPDGFRLKSEMLSFFAKPFELLLDVEAVS